MNLARIGEQPVNRPPAEDARDVRLLALGGVLQLTRSRHQWTVAEAAAEAQIAPMTWRRVEEGLVVRERTHSALDRMFGLSPGTVKRALADDLVMVDVVKLAGVDARHVAADNAGGFLEDFAAQTLAHTPRQDRQEGARLKVVGGGAHRELRPPATDLELVNRVVEQLARSRVQTPAVRKLIDAAAAAVPDLVAAAIAGQDDPR